MTRRPGLELFPGEAIVLSGVEAVEKHGAWDPSDRKSVGVATRAVKLDARHVALVVSLKFHHLCSCAQGRKSPMKTPDQEERTRTRDRYLERREVKTNGMGKEDLDLTKTDAKDYI